MRNRLTRAEREERAKDELERYAVRMARRFKIRIMPDAPKGRRLVSYEKSENGFYKFTYANGAVFYARGPLVNMVIEGKRLYEKN